MCEANEIKYTREDQAIKSGRNGIWPTYSREGRYCLTVKAGIKESNVSKVQEWGVYVIVHV